jgi:hypothetical protein
MHRSAFFAALLLMTLCSCAEPPRFVTSAQSPPKPTRLIALGHRHHDHSRSNAVPSKASRVNPRATSIDEENAERAKVLMALQPYSAAWWAVHDEIEAENDRRLNRKLVICRGCFNPKATEDQTGSILGK